MKSRRLIIIAAFLGLGLLNSCEKEKIFPPTKDATIEFYELMDQWYYWKDSIADIDPDDYSTPSDLLEAMRFLPKDRWSYITTKEEHAQYYEEGTYVGYGFGYSADVDGNIRITFLFEDSDLNDFDIKRGWIIKKINNTVIDENTNVSSLMGADEVGVSNSFEFESPTGETVSQSFNKKTVEMNTVGHEQVIDIGGTKVGYFVFKSFIGPSNDELSNVFNYFNSEGVDELVVDLRYNGGGRMDVVSHLAGLIIPDNVNGELFVRYEHNSDRYEYNENTYFEQEANSLKLNKVYFIASRGSASASEVIINSLDPYIDVYIVGDDTYGKPVGMYSFESQLSDYVYVPISFKLLNADGFGGYYDGLSADSYVGDDLLEDFGPGEDVLDEVLHHIEYGTFSSTKSTFDIPKISVKEIRNLRDEIGAI